MEITDFAKGQAWSIIPEKFEMLQRKFHEFRSADLEAAAGRSASGKDSGYTVVNGVAIIPIVGQITKRPSFFSRLFGGASVEDIREVYNTALSDPAVNAIVLDIDSPGGTVNGIDALAEGIFNTRSEKPLVAFGGGMMASAAYWIGSAAESVVVDKAADVGSIGVLMVHTDFSEYDKRVGVKTTYLTAGKYKALGNDAEPLSDLARETFQKELDYLYGIFIDAVARNRGVDASAVREGMADGRIFIGQQAVDAGLADKVGTLDTAVETALSLVRNSRLTIIRSGGVLPGKEKDAMFGKGKDVAAPSNAEELAAMYPELAAQIRDQGAKSVETAGLVADAVAAERDRILGLSIIKFGEEAGATFHAVVESGVTVDQFKAITALNPPPAPPQDAEAALKERLLTAIQGAGAENPGPGDGGAGPGPALSVEDQARQDFAKKQEIRDEFVNEAAYVAFKRAEADGRVKIFKKKEE